MSFADGMARFGTPQDAGRDRGTDNLERRVRALENLMAEQLGIKNIPAITQARTVQEALEALATITTSGTAVIAAATAGEALSGHRAVRFNAGSAFYADRTAANAAHAAGITTGAAAMGAAVGVQIDGELTEPSWTWAPGPVWLGLTGFLTQVIPTSGSIVRIGTAKTATTIIVEPQFITAL